MRIESRTSAEGKIFGHAWIMSLLAGVEAAGAAEQNKGKATGFNAAVAAFRVTTESHPSITLVEFGETVFALTKLTFDAQPDALYREGFERAMTSLIVISGFRRECIVVPEGVSERPIARILNGGVEEMPQHREPAPEPVAPEPVPQHREPVPEPVAPPPPRRVAAATAVPASSWVAPAEPSAERFVFDLDGLGEPVQPAPRPAQRSAEHTARQPAPRPAEHRQRVYESDMPAFAGVAAAALPASGSTAAVMPLPQVKRDKGEFVIDAVLLAFWAAVIIYSVLHPSEPQSVVVPSLTSVVAALYFGAVYLRQ